MKKSTIIFLLILYCFPKSFGQTVTIDAITVNNTSISNGTPINLGLYTTSTITFSASVVLPTASSDNYPGTINIYYKKNDTSAPTMPTGGNGGNLLFSGGTSSSRNFIISLESSDFDISSGFLYAEYENYYHTKYKSSNVAIIKSSNNNGGNPPIITSDHPIQIVPFGGIPLIPTLSKSSSNYSQSWQEIIPSSYVQNRDGTTTFVPEHDIDISNPEIETYSNKKYKIKYLINGQIAYAQNNLMEINVKEFFPTLNGRSYYRLSNQITNDNQYIPQGQNPTVITGNEAFEEHSEGRGMPSIKTLYNNYQWQSRIINYNPFTMSNFNDYNIVYGWKDIPNATQENYTPQSAPYGIEYRRLVIKNPNEAIYNRITAASNVVAVYPVYENNTTGTSICCDQTYNISATNPIPTINPIIGEHKYPNPYFGKYQWQISTDGITWNNINYNADLKDYQPLISDLQTYNGRTSTIISPMFFRRIFIDLLDYQYSSYYISNVIKITINNTNKKTNIKEEIKNDVNDNTISIYPNPSTSIITIEGLDNKSSFKLKVVDLTGKTVISKKPDQSSNQLLQIDISTLQNGIYTLELENESTKLTKKLIKN